MLPLAFVLLVQVALSDTPRAGGAVLCGEVVWVGGDSALPDVTVELEGAGRTVTATTDQRGVYRFGGLGPGEYRARAHLSGFRSQMQTATLSMAGSTRLNFALSLSEVDTGPCCRITGTVRDPQGAFLAGARVVLVPVLGNETVLPIETDGRGKYSLDLREPGEYIAFAFVPALLPRVCAMSVQPQGYAHAHRADFVVDRRVPQRAPGAREERDQRSAVFHGQVLSLLGLPIADATVSFSNESTGRSVTVHADAQGSYRSGGQVAGDCYTVTAEASGYMNEQRRRCLLSGEQDVREDFTLLHARPADAAGYEVIGTVRDASGVAVEGAAATLFAAFSPGVRSRAYTDSAGSFALRVSHAGVYVADAYLRGRRISARTVRLGLTSDTAPTVIDFVLDRR